MCDIMCIYIYIYIYIYAYTYVKCGNGRGESSEMPVCIPFHHFTYFV